MLAILKRYGAALLFLFIISLLMLGGTMAVMYFGENMVKEMGIEMKPRGEDLNKKGMK